MAFRLGLGRGFGALRPRWGVRGSLFAAFAVIAAMSIAISAGAGFVLRNLGGTMEHPSGRNIPRLATSLQLSAQAASLAAQGPALLAAPSEDALGDRIKKLKDIQQETQLKLGEVIELSTDRAAVSALSETIKNFDEATESLIKAARERLGAAAQHDKRFDAMRAAQAAFVAAASPAMLDAQTQVNAILGSANLTASDATTAAQTIGQLGNVIASGNLAVADLIATLSANSNDKLDDIEKEFKGAQGRLRSNLDLLPENAGTKTLRAAAEKLLAFGAGKSSVFQLRQKELDALDYGQTVLDEARKLNIVLDISVQQLVESVQKETNAAAFHARQEISFATMIMLAMGAATLVGSVLFVWLYVGGNILRRIGSLQHSMKLLSDGDLDTEIYRSSQHGESAAMSESLQVFRDSMIRARALSADQDKDRVTKSERAARMEGRIAEFEAAVR